MDLKQYRAKATITLEYLTHIPTWMGSKQRLETEVKSLVCLLVRDFDRENISVTSLELSTAD